MPAKKLYDTRMKQFSFKLPSSTAQAIQRLAVLGDTSIGEVARRLLEDGATRQVEEGRRTTGNNQ